MFCPNCGAERSSTGTNFCSRCGFLLTGTEELMKHDGKLPQVLARGWKGNSPRNRGIKQGLFIFLLSFLIVPLAAIFTVARNAEPYLVVISAIFLTVGGLLRVVYALMFESDLTDTDLAAKDTFPSSVSQARLSAGQAVANEAYAPEGGWRDTNDFVPTSVTDNTTKLLEQEETS